MRRRAVAALALLLLLAAAPASADDIFAIDGRLQEAGLPEAVVDVLETDAAPRVVVDFDVRGRTPDDAAYRAQALQAAEVVWDHLEVRVGAVDVQPTYAAPWLDGQLPPVVSYTRADLEAGFGPRPPELDEETDAYAAGGDGFVEDSYLLLPLLGGLVLLLLVAAVVLLVVLVVRGRRRPDPYDGWGAPVQAARPLPPPGDPWRSPPGQGPA